MLNPSELPKITARDKFGKFLKGHPQLNTGRTHFKKGNIGNKCCNWKKGETIGRNGYVFKYCPNHPFANGKQYIYKHRLIVEKMIGRFLKPEECVHHLNSNKLDNHKKNLMAFISQSAHIRFHKDFNNIKPEEIIFDGRKL